MGKEMKLVGLSEIASLAGVTKQVVANWRSRDSKDFPEPLSELKSGPVWTLESVETWATARGIALREEVDKNTSSKSEETTKGTTVALTNMKGGVGKSTIAANLGWYCAYRGNKKVLLVDLDPQFNLSQYVMGTDGYEDHISSDKPTVINIFEEFTPSVVAPGKLKKFDHGQAIAHVRKWDDGSGIDIIPSCLELAWTLKNPHSKDHLLQDYLDDIRDEYDVILIDCPPTESMLTEAAYLASNFVLVPVRPEFLSTIGLPLLARSLEDFRSRHKKAISPQIAGIVFNHASGSPEQHRSRQLVKKVAAQNQWHVFKNEIGYSDSYPAGARAGKPIFLTDYARSWKKAEFERFAAEFVSGIGL